MDESSNVIIKPLSTDPASLFMQFQLAMASKEPVPDQVLQWLVDGLRVWAERGGKEDLARTLGLREALKELGESHRMDRDEEILFEMDTLVFLGARPEDAAAIIAESLDTQDALTEDTLVRKFKSKRVRAGVDAIRMRLAVRGGPRRFLASFKETYMPEQLLSMKHWA